MDINISHLPTTFDLLHIILALSTALFLLFFLLSQVKIQRHNQAKLNTVPLENSTKHVENTSKPVELKESGPEAAYQLLTLLQQNGRFIDFIQEDLKTYSDADIGAAARVVHEGSQQIINEYFDLVSIRSEEEESPISIEKGFNASEIKLTGNVIGQAPFNGILIHKGWKISKSQLPKLTPEHDASIIAAAEIEL